MGSYTTIVGLEYKGLLGYYKCVDVYIKIHTEYVNGRNLVRIITFLISYKLSK